MQKLTVLLLWPFSVVTCHVQAQGKEGVGLCLFELCLKISCLTYSLKTVDQHALIKNCLIFIYIDCFVMVKNQLHILETIFSSDVLACQPSSGQTGYSNVITGDLTTEVTKMVDGVIIQCRIQHFLWPITSPYIFWIKQSVGETKRCSSQQIDPTRGFSRFLLVI